MNQAVVTYIKDNLQAGYSLEDIKEKLVEAGHGPEAIEAAVNEANRGQGVEGEVPRPDFSVRDQEVNSNGKPLGFWKKVVMVLSSPNELFAKTKAEDVWPPLKYQTLILLIMGAVQLGLVLVMISLMGLGFSGELEFILSGMIGMGTVLLLPLLVLLFLVVLTFAIVFSLIMAGVVHLLVLLFGGQGGYAGSYKALVYGATPSSLLGFIPVVNLIAMIWGFVLVVLGLASYHSMTVVKAVAILLIPIIAWIGFIAVVLFASVTAL